MASTVWVLISVRFLGEDSTRIYISSGLVRQMTQLKPEYAEDGPEGVPCCEILDPVVDLPQSSKSLGALVVSDRVLSLAAD